MNRETQNQNVNKEPAEGSRETAATNQGQADRGSAQHGAGITNRPLEREQKEQEEVPPRGQTKDEEHGGSDAGRTSGGGSSGHDQPESVKRDTPVRNG